jgi:hypothetical protein
MGCADGLWPMECSHYSSELNQTFPLFAEESFEYIREETLRHGSRLRYRTELFKSLLYQGCWREHLLGCWVPDKTWQQLFRAMWDYAPCKGNNNRITRTGSSTFLAQQPQWATASSFTRSLDHTQRRTKVGRTPLDERSTRRRELFLTTQNTQNRQTPMPQWDSNPQSQQASGRRPTL